MSRLNLGSNPCAATGAGIAQANPSLGPVRKTAALVCALSAILVAPNTWAQQVVFSDANSFLVQAIRTGQVSGLLTGPIDEHFSRQFHSSGALRVKARVVRDLVRSDCKHLEVVYTKEGVLTPKGMTQAILSTELDYCLNGEPPMVQGMTQGLSNSQWTGSQ